MKEIVLEDVTYAHKQSRINAFTLENTVYIGSVAVELLGKPRSRTSLVMEDLFYDTPYMSHATRIINRRLLTDNINSKKA